MSANTRKPDPLALIASALQIGPSLLRPLPRPLTVEERLAVIPTEDLPLQAETTIHWNDRQVPFVEASTDDDLAFAVGMVHAHLRLGQMEISRRVATGRLSEMAGPIAIDIDHSLRVLDLGRAVPDIEAVMPDDTRAWIDNFVRGVNYYVDHADALPPEFDLLGLGREPWTPADVLTLGRLTATDVNWLVWLPLLKFRDDPEWPRLWQRLIDTGGASLPSFRKPGRLAFLSRLLGGLGRSGSNAIAVSARRSSTGAAMVANDPHLNIMLPNLWLIIGCKSPSYHMVGKMLPGLPFVGLGRNPHIAWGGTNMRAASSDLYAVEPLGPDEIETREVTIGVRGWADQKVTVRSCRLGPILSDTSVAKEAGCPPVALRWLGYAPSDELTAMLRMNRATNWAEYRAAFRTFGVPGLNMLYADTLGNIGQILAVHLPDRRDFRPPDLILDPHDPAADWGATLCADDLPMSFNPREGYLVSANNRPVEAQTAISYFFAPDDRLERIQSLLEGVDKVDLARLQAIQQDVYMPSAAKLNALFVAKIDEAAIGHGMNGGESAVIDLLRAWDAHYHIESRGSLAFELVLFHFTRLFSGDTLAEYAAAAHSGVVRLKSLLVEDIAGAATPELIDALRAAIRAAARDMGRFANWGEMHRMRLDHPLAVVPGIGRRYRFGDYPVAGSSDTVMKTAHGLTDQRHGTPYGAVSRHISDLSDPDRNFFALLGGQDGWLNSSTFVDQVALWRQGRYIQVPLRLSTVRTTFAHRSVLHPRTSM